MNVIINSINNPIFPFNRKFNQFHPSPQTPPLSLLSPPAHPLPSPEVMCTETAQSRRSSPSPRLTALLFPPEYHLKAAVPARPRHPARRQHRRVGYRRRERPSQIGSPGRHP